MNGSLLWFVLNFGLTFEHVTILFVFVITNFGHCSIVFCQIQIIVIFCLIHFLVTQIEKQYYE